jgi:2-dehydro-3-deoxyphosphogluconate aldolase / (4S)-4-hydroxy-2-oxoglutarate aldolase
MWRKKTRKGCINLKQETIDIIEKNKIIAICRGIYGNDLLQLVTALHEGGIRLVEVTFDQKEPACIQKTSAAIRSLRDKFGKEVAIGAGTVLNEEQVVAARDAGAQYIISPNVNHDVIRLTKVMGMAAIPGAMTPTEILAAHAAGADFVKLFPAGTMGVRYAKDIMGPINHVRFIATAGITPDNIDEFLALGFAGMGISNYLTNQKLVHEGAFDILCGHARELMEAVHRYS